MADPASSPPATAQWEEPPPFLEAEPPPLVARGLAWILLLLCAAAAAALFLVRVPETVTAPFVLAPERGTDPVKTLREGVVREVRVTEGQSVGSGEPMFVVASEPVGDRSAERLSLDRVLAGAGERLENERRKRAGERHADEEEARKLGARSKNLVRTIDLKRKQMALAGEVADRQKTGFDKGVASWVDSSRPRLEADGLAAEAAQAETDLADTRGAIEKLGYDMEARDAAFREIERSLAEEMDKSRIRRDALEKDPTNGTAELFLPAPCAGTVVGLEVRRPGAVVEERETLAHVACSGEPLRAELSIPETGIGLVRPGQEVKLLYDAFPYERYGVRYGTLSWVSPARATAREGTVFRAFADLRDVAVRVEGTSRAFLPGMGGRALVVVGRRSLASHAFEPIRRLKESLAAGPGPGQ